MNVHRLLVEELTARLGAAHAEGERYTWHVDEGGSRINIVVDLHSEQSTTRLWLFNPRDRDESIRQFHVDRPEQVDRIVAEVSASLGARRQRARAAGDRHPSPHSRPPDA